MTTGNNKKIIDDADNIGLNSDVLANWLLLGLTYNLHADKN